MLDVLVVVLPRMFEECPCSCLRFIELAVRSGVVDGSSSSRRVCDGDDGASPSSQAKARGGWPRTKEKSRAPRATHPRRWITSATHDGEPGPSLVCPHNPAAQ